MVDVLTRSLADCRVSVGLSWRNLGHAFANRNEQRPVDARQWGVLYLGAAKLGIKPRQLCKDPLIAIDRKGEPVVEAVASVGTGVFDTLKAVAKQVLTELRKG